MFFRYFVDRKYRSSKPLGINSDNCTTVGIRDCFNDLKMPAVESQNAWYLVLLNLLSSVKKISHSPNISA